MGKDIRGRNLGTGVSQRKDGRYEARCTLRSGTRMREYFDNPQAARQWLADTRYNDQHSNIGAASAMTVDAWNQYWMENFVHGKVRPNTERNYRERYEKNVKPVLGNMVISDVKPMHCQRIFNQMEGSYSVSTMYQTYITMGIMFRVAVENNVIPVHPLTKSVKLPPAEKKEPRVLTPEEQELFLRYAEGTSNEAQYRFLLETGLRTGEMVGLKWSDLDFQNRTITIERTMEYRPSVGEWRVGPPKSKAGYRTIPMTEACYQVLMDVKRKRAQAKVIVPEMKDFVFLNRDGLPTKNSTYDAHIYKLTQKAGMKNFSMHSLRHTFSTRCIDAGMRPKTLQKILGHSNLSVTMDRYVHVQEDTLRNEMQKFEQYTSKTG